jgi:hypothetical protein
MATIEGGKTNNSYIKRLQDALADAKKKAATKPYIPRTTTINKNAGQKNYSGRNIVDKRDKYNYPERPRGGVPKKPEPIYPRMGDSATAILPLADSEMCRTPGRGNTRKGRSTNGTSCVPACHTLDQYGRRSNRIGKDQELSTLLLKA